MTYEEKMTEAMQQGAISARLMRIINEKSSTNLTFKTPDAFEQWLISVEGLTTLVELIKR